MIEPHQMKKNLAITQDNQRFLAVCIGDNTEYYAVWFDTYKIQRDSWNLAHSFASNVSIFSFPVQFLQGESG